jgi:superfamily II DNA helicase RecQ|tara:strand:- start:1860 stop:2075 length:216 start_codon:yes stop_codon:yes gene_type:complete
MNIWLEYFKYNDNRNNNHAQMKENAKWIPPDPEKISKRFCQSRKDAQKLAKRLNDDGYHVSIKTDGMGNIS